jgi:hypothetical protein
VDKDNQGYNGSEEKGFIEGKDVSELTDTNAG